ncbi:MAG: hypothetical protein WEB04_00305 [Dehalococcoidia bacterium]
MMKTLRILFLGSFAMGLLIVASLIGASAAAEGETEATVHVDSATIAIDGDASVDVEVLGVGPPGLGAWSVDIGFDDTVVAAIGCDPDNGSVCNPAFSVNAARVVGADPNGLEGDTLLATLRFRCVELGSSPLTLTNNVIADATVGGPGPQDLKTVVQNGNITCQEAIPIPTSTPAVPPPPPPPPGGGGATFVKANGVYRGDIAGGGTIEAVVSSDGSGISSIRIDGFNTVCGLISQIVTVNPPAPIQNNHFETLFYNGDDVVTVSGNFLSSNTIEGIISIFPEDLECVQPPRTFVLSLVPPAGAAPSSPPGGSLPSAGLGSGPTDWSMINWYIAGLIGAGIAWLIAGLSGAGLALSGRGRSNARVSNSRAKRRNDGGIPPFVALRPRPAKPVVHRSAPVAPRGEAPRPAPRFEPRADGMPSFVSLRRRRIR